MHAVVSRSTFPSQNVQNTPGSDHFWKLRCRKSARRCGAKHILKSKGVRSTLARSDVVLRGRHKGFSTLPMSKTRAFCSSFNYNHHYTTNYNYITLHYADYITLHYATPHHTTLHYTNYNYNYNCTTLHYTTLEYTTLHYPTLHYTTLITVHHLIVSIFPRGRFITLHSLQIQLPLRYTNYTAPQLQLHHATTTTATTAALRHTTSSSCG